MQDARQARPVASRQQLERTSAWRAASWAAWGAGAARCPATPPSLRPRTRLRIALILMTLEIRSYMSWDQKVVYQNAKYIYYNEMNERNLHKRSLTLSHQSKRAKLRHECYYGTGV